MNQNMPQMGNYLHESQGEDEETICNHLLRILHCRFECMTNPKKEVLLQNV